MRLFKQSNTQATQSRKRYTLLVKINFNQSHKQTLNYRQTN